MKLNLLKPLKRIFTALSGEETEDKNLVSVMDKIADVVEEGGGGSNLPDIDWTDLTNGVGQLFACRRNGIVFLNNPGTAMTNFALTELPEEFVPEDGDGYSGVIVAPFFSSNYAATIVGRLLIEYGSGVGNISYHAAPNETGNGSMFISYPAKINNTNNNTDNDNSNIEY